ncbi:MAG TPA: DUF167 family protein [Alphaproteobacteria bacterium]|jgi:hypothetical protein|nr:DUF167 family protein [Alphaproteobacteria bacterium]
MDTPLAITPGGVSVAIRLTPKAARAGIAGFTQTPDGPALKVKVTAPPESGKANAALLHLLAREWKVAPSRLALAAGARSRRKTVHFDDAAPDEIRRLQTWMESVHV